MALALYRKYRPRTFAEVIGQEHVTEPLSQALRSGRLHHAYLFSGPRGCGKTSSARILARSLNCEQGPTPEPCGVCQSCRSLANDGAGSIDVIEIDAASHGGVDDARELREKAFFAPASSRYKIYVIDEAHMVSSAGFNALLKLVEEPPEYVKFIFATTEPEKVLGTIRSRTHHYPFRLIPPATLRPYLQQLTEAEGVAVEPAVFPLVVRAGGGSARDSLSVLDQLIAGAGPDGVSYARAVALLGVTDVTLIDEMCDALAAGDGATAYATIDRVAEAGHDPRRFASDLLERFRDLIVLQQVPDAVAKGLIDGPADQLEAMSAQAARLGQATLSRCADIVHNGLVEMRGTTAPRLLLELITARMLLPGAEDSTGALLQRLERMERRLTLSGDSPVRMEPDPVAPPAVVAPVAGSPVAAPQAAGEENAAPVGSPGGGGLSAARAAAAAAAKRAAGGGGRRPGAPAGSGPALAAPAGAPVTAASAPASPGVPAADSPTAAAPAAASLGGTQHEASAEAPAAASPGAPAQTSATPAGVSPGPTPQAPEAAAQVAPAPTEPVPAEAAPMSAAASPAVDPASAPASFDDEPPWDDEPEPDPYEARPVSGAAPSAAVPQEGVRPAAVADAAPAQDHASGPTAASSAPAERRERPSGILPDAPEDPGAAAVEAAVPGQLTAAAVREVWPEVVSMLGRQSKRLAALARDAVVRDLQGETLVLTFQHAKFVEMITPGLPAVANVLYEVLGGRWEVRCEVAGQGGAVAPAPRSGGRAGQSYGGGRDSARNGASGSRPERAAPTDPGAQQAQAAAARPPQSRRQAEAPASAGDDDWPEPVKPGGLAPAGASAAQPAPAEEEDWPEVSPIGTAASRSEAEETGAAAGRSEVGSNSAAVNPSASGSDSAATEAGGDEVGGVLAGAPPGHDDGNAPSGGGVAAAGGDRGDGSHGGGVAAGAGRADHSGAGERPGGSSSGGALAGGASAGGGPSGSSNGNANGDNTARSGGDRPGSAASSLGGGALGTAGSGAPGVSAGSPSPVSSGSADARAGAGSPASVGGGAAPGRTGRNAGPSSGLAAARAAAAAAAAARQGGGRPAAPAAAPSPAATNSAWSDGSPTEEAPYDPEFDGPPARGAAPASAFEGFDPGDEPLDEVIDEKTARESSEQQALRLLREAFGAEKIGES